MTTTLAPWLGQHQRVLAADAPAGAGDDAHPSFADPGHRRLLPRVAASAIVRGHRVAATTRRTDGPAIAANLPPWVTEVGAPRCQDMRTAECVVASPPATARRRLHRSRSRDRACVLVLAWVGRHRRRSADGRSPATSSSRAGHRRLDRGRARRAGWPTSPTTSPTRRSSSHVRRPHLETTAGELGADGRRGRPPSSRRSTSARTARSSWPAPCLGRVVRLAAQVALDLTRQPRAARHRRPRSRATTAPPPDRARSSQLADVGFAVVPGRAGHGIDPDRGRGPARSPRRPAGGEDPLTVDVEPRRRSRPGSATPRPQALADRGQRPSPSDALHDQRRRRVGRPSRRPAAGPGSPRRPRPRHLAARPRRASRSRRRPARPLPDVGDPAHDASFTLEGGGAV